MTFGVRWLDTVFPIAFFFRVEGDSCARAAALQKNCATKGTNKTRWSNHILRMDGRGFV